MDDRLIDQGRSMATEEKNDQSNGDIDAAGDNAKAIKS
jgi:hypothetical protein